MTEERIIDRIRKLLELSRSTNEHEAATAAARAAELMSEHQVSAAMLEVSASKDEVVPHVAERIVEEGMDKDHQTRQRVAWRDQILTWLAHSLDLERYFSEGNLIVFGRESNVATWKYTGMYLVAEVDRLANEAWLREGADIVAVGGTPKAWKGAFRLGAADTIADRLQKEHAKQREKERVHAKELAGATEGGSSETVALARVNQALDIIAKDRAEVAEKYKARRKVLGLRSIPGTGRTTRGRSGYSAGREAGQSVNLKGGGKALKA